MDRIKNIHARSILPFLVFVMLVLQMPVPAVKALRKACLYVAIPAQKIVSSLAFFLPDQEVLLSFYHQLSKIEQHSSALISASLETSPTTSKEFASTHITPFDLEGISAQVVFRQPRLCSHCVWINVGSMHNDKAGRALVGVNSPVLSSGNLVGVVDEVLQRVSRVRLITDKQFTPSVRAIKGSDSVRYLLFKLNQDLDYLSRVSSSEKDLEISALISQIQQNLLKGEEGSQLLGRGELEGSIHEALKTASLEVKGVAFNYEEEGNSSFSEGDLLVTTGLDGVFYKGLPVAQVSFVDKEKREEPFYKIRAKLLATDLFSLQHVTVLPSRAADI